MAQIPTANELFMQHIRERCAAVGVMLDTFDPDYLLGTMMGWLEHHDAVLTADGIKKVSEL